MKRAFLFCFFLFLVLSIADARISYRGLKIVDVIGKFQQQGLKINYSSRLVTADMVVIQDPRSDSPIEILNEVLNPHGLMIMDGPENIYLVVRKPVEISTTQTATSDIAENVVVPYVTVHVVAEGLKGRFINTLQAKDFTVKEDGAEQPITEFINLSDAQEDQEKLSVLLLVDQSLSMSEVHSGVRKYDFVQKAALKFLEQLQPGDRLATAAFDQDFRMLSDLTQDRNILNQSLQREPELKARTALLDILPEAIEKMKNFPDRKILILCSDGQDSASHSSVESVVQSLQTSDVTIFTISSASGSSSWGRLILQKITEATGGYSFFAASESDLNNTIHGVRTAMSGQYVVGYVPRYPNVHKWRDVQVECRIQGVRLRYRNRYLF